MIIQPLSDLHGHLPDIPKCDLVLLAGDVCPTDDHSLEYQRDWMVGTFGPWMQSLPAQEIIWIAGNHDFITQQEGFSKIAGSLPGIYLEDSGTVWGGVSFWGSPWINTIEFGGGWAWETDEKGMNRAFSAIPESVDVLLSHSPPYGYGDRCQDGRRVGSESLASHVERTSPLLVVSGHIHEDPGVRHLEQTTLVSCSQLDERFEERSYLPPLLEVDKQHAEVLS